MHERQTYFSPFSLTFGLSFLTILDKLEVLLSVCFHLILKASSWNNKPLKRALFRPNSRTRNQSADDLSKEKIRAPLADNTLTHLGNDTGV